MIETRRYASNPREVDAVQVTAANMKAIVDWVGGTLYDEHGVETDSILPGCYVKVEVHNPMNDRQSQAFVGDWILYSTAGPKPSFKVFLNKAFKRNFNLVSDATILHGKQPAEEPLDPEMQKLMGLSVESGPENSIAELSAEELAPADTDLLDQSTEIVASSDETPVEDLSSGKSTDEILREQAEFAQSHQS